MEVAVELLASQLDFPCSILQNPGKTAVLPILPPTAPLDYCLLKVALKSEDTGKFLRL